MIERTQRRLRQARFLYQHLVNARHGDPEAFRFYFSAFIQSARSVTWTLKKEEREKWKKWEPTWRANRSEGERKLLKIATDLRNVEVKEGGANLPMELEEVVIDAFVETDRVEASNPMGATYKRTFALSNFRGIVSPWVFADRRSQFIRAGRPRGALHLDWRLAPVSSPCSQTGGCTEKLVVIPKRAPQRFLLLRATQASKRLPPATYMTD